MRYGQVTGIDKSISRIVQGTVMTQGLDEATITLFDAALASEINAFDTARAYGGGKTEQALGDWIALRGVRDQVVIITKAAHPANGQARVTPEDITADIHASQQALSTDHIELLLLHRDDPTKPVGPIIDVLNRHQRAGDIGAFGASNWSPQRIGEANAYAAANGLQPFAVSSPHFSLAEMVHEPWPGCLSIGGEQGAAARAWYTEHKIPLFAWSSLAGGFFSGRFRRDNLDTFHEYFDEVVVKGYASEDNFKRLDRAEQLAAEKGLTLAQIAIAYVLNQPLDLYALLAPRTPEEVAQNVAMLDVTLTPAELAWLDLRSDER